MKRATQISRKYRPPCSICTSNTLVNVPSDSDITSFFTGQDRLPSRPLLCPCLERRIPGRKNGSCALAQTLDAMFDILFLIGVVGV